MAERLETWHDEVEVSNEELVRTVRILEINLKDPENTPRMREEIDRRIGHLVFEYHSRKYRDKTV